MEAVVKAANFAAVKHRDQRRKDAGATPYINHPIGVAHILVHEGGVDDPVVIQAALLHDTVEDTDTSLEEIRREFGPEVESVVAEVTDDKSLPKAERKERQVQRAPGSSTRAKLVKLADKLYNLRDLDRPGGAPLGWDQPRVDEYWAWSARVVGGIGRGTNPALEAELDKLFLKHGVQPLDQQKGTTAA